MTEEERIHNLQGFGYSTEEARFLGIVALHSGYFVRRQFDAAIGVERGKRTSAFVEKLLARGHARRYTFEHNRQVFQLQYKPFYEAVGDEHSRNRREHQPQTIKARLMGLDFVQANPHCCFFATEQQKMASLGRLAGVPRDVLPAKVYAAHNGGSAIRRYFVDRFPVFVKPSPNRSSPCFGFAFIDSGFDTTSAFVTYLRHYKGLFQAIGEFDLVYAGTRRALFGTAEKTFHRVLSGLGGQSLTPRDLCRLLAYFHDWNLFERGQSRVLSLERMNSLREDRAEFGSPFHDGLFDLWKKGGERAVRTEIGIRNVCQGRFSRHVFPFDYDLFGALEVAS